MKKRFFIQKIIFSRVFGALSDAQLHFLVHHFTKCSCEKHPKIITTCWQDWDEKLLEPEVAKSAPELIAPNQISKPDGNQTSEVKPNPRYQFYILLSLKFVF